MRDMGFFSRTRRPSYGRARPTLAPLYTEHFNAVINSLRSFGVPERDAPDVAQDVWMRVDASLDRYDPTRAIKPWLKVITYRTAQDYLRSTHSRPVLLPLTEDIEDTENDMEVMDTAPGPDRHRLLTEMQQAFADALQALNEDQRIVYMMHTMDEIPIPEIAEALGELENTVRSRLSRAHQMFDAAVARRRTGEERRQSALAPMLVPAMLADAARKGFGVDPGVKAVVWSKLTRLLGLGVAAPRPAFLCLSAGSVRCSHDGEAKSRQRGRGSSQRDRDGLAACGAPGLHRPERSDRARHG